MNDLWSLSARLALLSVSAIVLGCQTYEANPPDLASHHQAWLSRSPADDDVASFVMQLREAGATTLEFDLTDGVSLAEAELVALVFNADLRMSRAEAGVAAATAENAGLWDDPKIGVDIMRILASVPNPWMVMSSVGFTVPLSGRLGVEKSKAGSEHAASLARVADMEWKTVHTLRRTWIEWSAAAEQVRVTDGFIEELGALVGIVDEMQSVGELSRLEGRLFHIERLTSEQAMKSLTAMRDSAAIEIRRLMGLAPGAEVELAAQTHVEPGAVVTSDDVRALLERSLSLRTLRTEYEVAERSLELEIRKQYPDLNIGPGYEYEEGNNRVGVGMSIPLPIFNANRQAIAEARAAREKALASLETGLESLLTDLALADVAVASASDRRTHFERDVAPLVDAQYHDAREVARLGEVDTWLLLETLRKRFEVKKQLISLVQEESAAVIARDALIGRAPIETPAEAVTP